MPQMQTQASQQQQQQQPWAGQPRLLLQRQVWIVGDHFVMRAGKQAKVTRDSSILSNVTWLGKDGGACLTDVPQRLLEYSRSLPPPTTIVIHTGTHDIGKIEVKLFQNSILATFKTIRRFWPKCIIVWSDILPSLSYNSSLPGGTQDPTALNLLRRAMNKYARREIKKFGRTSVLNHSNIQVVNTWQFGNTEKDKGHLSTIGYDLFLQGLEQGLEEVLLRDLLPNLTTGFTQETASTESQSGLSTATKPKSQSSSSTATKLKFQSSASIATKWKSGGTLSITPQFKSSTASKPKSVGNVPASTKPQSSSSTASKPNSEGNFSVSTKPRSSSSIASKPKTTGSVAAASKTEKDQDTLNDIGTKSASISQCLRCGSEKHSIVDCSLDFSSVPTLSADEAKQANTKEQKLLVQKLEHFKEYPEPTKRMSNQALNEPKLKAVLERDTVTYNAIRHQALQLLTLSLHYWAYEKVIEPLFCFVCDIKYQTEDRYQAHVSGQWHRDNFFACRVGSKDEKRSQVIQCLSDLPSIFTSDCVSEEEPTHPLSDTEKWKALVKQRSTRDIHLEGTELYFFCRVCSDACQGPVQAHVNSPRHQFETNRQVQCPKCHLLFRQAHMLHTHVKSLLHKLIIIRHIKKNREKLRKPTTQPNQISATATSNNKTSAMTVKETSASTTAKPSKPVAEIHQEKLKAVLPRDIEKANSVLAREERSDDPTTKSSEDKRSVEEVPRILENTKEAVAARDGRGKSDERKDVEELEPVAMEFVMPVTGFFCKLCAKFYDNTKTNKERHCSTSQHKTKAAIWYVKRKMPMPPVLQATKEAQAVLSRKNNMAAQDKSKELQQQVTTSSKDQTGNVSGDKNSGLGKNSESFGNKSLTGEKLQSPPAQKREGKNAMQEKACNSSDQVDVSEHDEEVVLMQKENEGQDEDVIVDIDSDESENGEEEVGEGSEEELLESDEEEGILEDVVEVEEQEEEGGEAEPIEIDSDDNYQVEDEESQDGELVIDDDLERELENQKEADDLADQRKSKDCDLQQKGEESSEVQKEDISKQAGVSSGKQEEQKQRNTPVEKEGAGRKDGDNLKRKVTDPSDRAVEKFKLPGILDEADVTHKQVEIETASSDMCRIVVAGHSFVGNLVKSMKENKRWYSKTASEDFGLEGCQIHMGGVNERTIDLFTQFDIGIIEAFRPDLLFLQLGTYDLVNPLVTAQMVAKSLVELAEGIHKDYKTKLIYICEILPRSCKPRAVSSFNGKAKLCNKYIEQNLKKYDFCCYWRHSKCWKPNNDLYVEDGVNLTDQGNLKLFESYRHAVIEGMEKLSGGTVRMKRGTGRAVSEIGLKEMKQVSDSEPALVYKTNEESVSKIVVKDGKRSSALAAVSGFGEKRVGKVSELADPGEAEDRKKLSETAAKRSKSYDSIKTPPSRQAVLRDEQKSSDQESQQSCRKEKKHESSVVLQAKDEIPSSAKGDEHKSMNQEERKEGDKVDDGDELLMNGFMVLDEIGQDEDWEAPASGDISEVDLSEEEELSEDEDLPSGQLSEAGGNEDSRSRDSEIAGESYMYMDSMIESKLGDKHIVLDSVSDEEDGDVDIEEEEDVDVEGEDDISQEVQIPDDEQIKESEDEGDDDIDVEGEDETSNEGNAQKPEEEQDKGSDVEKEDGVNQKENIEEMDEMETKDDEEQNLEEKVQEAQRKETDVVSAGDDGDVDVEEGNNMSQEGNTQIPDEEQIKESDVEKEDEMNQEENIQNQDEVETNKIEVEEEGDMNQQQKQDEVEIKESAVEKENGVDQKAIIQEQDKKETKGNGDVEEQSQELGADGVVNNTVEIIDQTGVDHDVDENTSRKTSNIFDVHNNTSQVMDDTSKKSDNIVESQINAIHAPGNNTSKKAEDIYLPNELDQNISKDELSKSDNIFESERTSHQAHHKDKTSENAKDASAQINSSQNTSDNEPTRKSDNIFESLFGGSALFQSKQSQNKLTEGSRSNDTTQQSVSAAKKKKSNKPAPRQLSDVELKFNELVRQSLSAKNKKSKRKEKKLAMAKDRMKRIKNKLIPVIQLNKITVSSDKFDLLNQDITSKRRSDEQESIDESNQEEMEESSEWTNSEDLDTDDTGVSQRRKHGNMIAVASDSVSSFVDGADEQQLSKHVGNQEITDKEVIKNVAKTSDLENDAQTFDVEDDIKTSDVKEDDVKSSHAENGNSQGRNEHMSETEVVGENEDTLSHLEIQDKNQNLIESTKVVQNRKKKFDSSMKMDLKESSDEASSSQADTNETLVGDDDILGKSSDHKNKCDKMDVDDSKLVSEIDSSILDEATSSTSNADLNISSNSASSSNNRKRRHSIDSASDASSFTNENVGNNQETVEVQDNKKADDTKMDELGDKLDEGADEAELNPEIDQEKQIENDKNKPAENNQNILETVNVAQSVKIDAVKLVNQSVKINAKKLINDIKRWKKRKLATKELSTDSSGSVSNEDISGNKEVVVEKEDVSLKKRKVDQEADSSTDAKAPPSKVNEHEENAPAIEGKGTHSSDSVSNEDISCSKEDAVDKGDVSLKKRKVDQETGSHTDAKVLPSKVNEHEENDFAVEDKGTHSSDSVSNEDISCNKEDAVDKQDVSLKKRKVEIDQETNPNPDAQTDLGTSSNLDVDIPLSKDSLHVENDPAIGTSCNLDKETSSKDIQHVENAPAIGTSSNLDAETPPSQDCQQEENAPAIEGKETNEDLLNEIGSSGAPTNTNHPDIDVDNDSSSKDSTCESNVTISQANTVAENSTEKAEGEKARSETISVSDYARLQQDDSCTVVANEPGQSSASISQDVQKEQSSTQELNASISQSNSTTEQTYTIVVAGHSTVTQLDTFLIAMREIGIKEGFDSDNCKVELLGDENKTIAKFLEKDLAHIKDTKPDIVVLQLGAVDLAEDISPSEIASSLTKLIQKLHHDFGVKLIMLGQVLPRQKPSPTTKIVQVLNDILKRNVECMSSYAKFWIHGEIWNPGHNVYHPDGIHWNDVGLFILFKSFKEAISHALKSLEECSQESR